MLRIKQAKVYTPFYAGRKDVLLAGGKIEKIADSLDVSLLDCDEIDGSKLYLTPGLIDRHVHITGGGGEGGFATQVPPVPFSSLVQAGLTTVVGLLGTDGISRSIENLVARAKGLQEQGLSVYCMTGSYAFPPCTLTGSVSKDILFIDSILGCKLALSDHRTTPISAAELMSLASQVRTAGMLAGKAGILTLHMGEDPRGLELVQEALKQSSIPIQTFQPTHVQRNQRLLYQAFELARQGGYVDLTCGMHVEESLKQARWQNVPWENLTLSSDGQGSWSTYDADGQLTSIGVSLVDGLLRKIVSITKKGEISWEDMLCLCTINVAKALKLYPQKGIIQEDSDADVLLWDADLRLHTVIAKGEVLMREGTLMKKGLYE